MIRTSRLAAACALLTMALSLLSACTGTTAPAKGPDSAPPVAEAPAPAKARTKVSVAIPGKAMNFWPLLAGIRKGFFAEEGIDIDLVNVSSSSAAVQAMTSGSVQITQSAADTTITAVEKGAKLTIVAGGVNIPMYSLIVQSNIGSYADLKGKLVGVTGPNTGEAPIMVELLKMNGLQPGDYEVISAGFTSARYSALQQKAVVAALLTSPYEYQAIKDGFKELAFVPDQIKDYQYTATTMDTAWMQANRPVAANFLKAWLRSLHWLQDSKNKDEAVNIYSDESKVAPDVVAQAYSRYVEKGFPKDGEVSMPGMKKVIDELVSRKAIPASEQASKYVDESLLQEARKALKP